MRLLLPKYLQHNHIVELYAGLSKVSNDGGLELSFEQCVWADHFELQKLAVFLGGLPVENKTLTIRCYQSPSQNATEDLRANIARTIGVIDYANRINFFRLLHGRFGSGLTLVCGDKSINADTSTD